MNRVWRTLAIEWFEVWLRLSYPYFDNPPIAINDFITKTRKILTSDDVAGLNRFRTERAARAWCETVPIDATLVAIVDLALEDFK